jgi:CDP-glucose 4,6-dehydratase
MIEIGAKPIALVELARTAYAGNGEVHYNDGAEGPHEADRLALDAAKAQMALGFRPRWSVVQSVNQAMAWYWAQYDGGADARTLCQSDIATYESHWVEPAHGH